MKELEQVLAEEQSVLLSGNYKMLESLAKQKSRLAEKLANNSNELPVEAFGKLAEKAAQNEVLLKSARRGIQAAITQLNQIANGEHQSTYSREGTRKPLARQVSVTQKF